MDNRIPLGIMGGPEKIGPVGVPTGCVGPEIKSRGFDGPKNIPILFKGPVGIAMDGPANIPVWASWPMGVPAENWKVGTVVLAFSAMISALSLSWPIT